MTAQPSPSADEAERVCRACGSDALEHAFDAMEPGFELLRCRYCESLRTWPEVPDDEIGSWYPQAYYGDENVRFNPVMERMTHRFARSRAKTMSRGRPPGRVLDVGCGRGVMLAGFRDLGWEAHGVELSEDSAFHARERLGLDVFAGALEDAPFDDEMFDLVVFWHSLEHFRRPDLALDVATRLVAPGGGLVVAVPNATSWQAKLFGPKWFHLDVPRHYHHFGEEALRGMVERRGFVTEEVGQLNLEQNPYGVLQSTMNRLRFPENFLYSMLKRESARTHDLAKHPGLVAATIAALPAATTFALGLTAVEAAAGHGGTIELYATKR